jgi:hypothetical protein
MSKDKQILVAGAYVSLIAVLAAGMQLNDAIRKSPAQLKQELVPRENWRDTEDLFAWSDENSWFVDESSSRWV